MLKFTPSSFPYKNNINIGSVQVDDLNHIKTAGIPQFVLIETGAILKNQEKIINFASFETPLKLNSLWLDVSRESNESIVFSVHHLLNSTPTRVLSFELNPDKIPFNFPYVAIFPFNQLTIKAIQDIHNCFIFCEPAIALHHLQPSR